MSADQDDPLALLEKQVRRYDQEKRAAEAIRAARIKLVLGRDARSVFFATLALKLRPEVLWGIETCTTDGEILGYNPEFVLALSDEARVTVVAHEVLHLALTHHARRGHRDPKLWNVAADLSLNPLLQEAGYPIPPGGLLPGRGEYAHLPPGLSAEEYYERLLQPPKDGDEQGDEPGQDEPAQQPGGGQGQGEGEGEGPGQGQGPPDPGGMGSVQDAGGGSPAEQQQSKAEWEVAVAQAAQASKSRGDLPGGLARFVHDLLNPKPDVAEVLRQFVSQACPADYTWSKPSRRALAQKLYRPGLDGEDLGVVVMAVDTSGSIDDATLKKFGQVMQGVLEAYAGVKLLILYHDSRVAGVQEWTPEDGPLRMTPAGGGGTDHRPVFAWLDEHPEIEPTAIVCLTDAYSVFPDSPPSIPVLWAVVGNPNPRVPWGQTVEVN